MNNKELDVCLALNYTLVRVYTFLLLCLLR